VGGRGAGGRAVAGWRGAGPRLLPRTALERAPAGRSPSRSAELLTVLDGMATELLSPARVRARGVFRSEYVEAATGRRGGAGTNPARTGRLWSLLLTEAWCQSYLDRRGAAPAGRVPSARRAEGIQAGAPMR
jgi:hypothetical protein